EDTYCLVTYSRARGKFRLVMLMAWLLQQVVVPCTLLLAAHGAEGDGGQEAQEPQAEHAGSHG
ncbi:hypothetical protein, partial [Klebsiella aerogenes]|uniref:hypothetical protein n=1 Tax=Klebsiella aerogenes TaxID=548 RepID=UPI0019542D96